MSKETVEIEQSPQKSDYGVVRNRYANNKKASSFLSNLNVNTEEPNALFSLVKELAEINENLPMKARLTRNQINAFAKAYWYALRYDIQTLVDYCDEQLILTVSESGKGRAELAHVADAISAYEKARLSADTPKI